IHVAHAPAAEHPRRGNQSRRISARDRDHPQRQDRLRHQLRKQLGDADRRRDERTRRGNQSGPIPGGDSDHPRWQNRVRRKRKKQLGDADRPDDEHTRGGNRSERRTDQCRDHPRPPSPPWAPPEPRARRQPRVIARDWGRQGNEQEAPVGLALMLRAARLALGSGPALMPLRLLGPGVATAMKGSPGVRRHRRALVSAAMSSLAISLTLLTASATAAPAPVTAYVTNLGSNSVTPIDVATNTAAAEIGVGAWPER